MLKVPAFRKLIVLLRKHRRANELGIQIYDAERKISRIRAIFCSDPSEKIAGSE